MTGKLTDKLYYFPRMGVDKAPSAWYNRRMKNDNDSNVNDLLSRITSWSTIQEARSQGHTGSGAATKKSLEQQNEELISLLMDVVITLENIQQN